MYIGEKIKELRKKNNLTQEKLANYLCVSYQSVSKWETGASSPDLSLIIPLTKLLHVTADELLSPSKAEPDARYEKLKAEYYETYKTEDIQKRYEICETAVAEYPGDIDFLYFFAWAISNRSASFEEPSKRAAEQEKAIKLFGVLIKSCDSEKMRGNAIYGITHLLSLLGRRDEAKKYAELLPEEGIPTRESVWENCIEGEELIKFKQLGILKLFSQLLWDMSKMEYADFYDKIGALIKVMFEDGNYLGMNGNLYKANKSIVNRLMKNNDTDETERVITLLGQMSVYAFEYDKVVYEEKGVYRYTSALFDRLEENTTEALGSAETGLKKDFAEYLLDPKFDNLRECEDFKALTGK